MVKYSNPPKKRYWGRYSASIFPVSVQTNPDPITVTVTEAGAGSEPVRRCRLADF